MGRAIAWWLALAGVWLAVGDNHHPHEMVARAAGATAPPAPALGPSVRISPGIRLPRSTLGTLPHLVWRLALDTVLLLRALWQTVVLRRPVRGGWVSAPLDAADTPEGRGHRVFAVLGGSFGPNRVVGDAEGGRLVVPQPL